MTRGKRWHPSQESDELVFAACSRFLSQLGTQFDPHDTANDSERRGAATAVAEWLQQEWQREDLTREKIYPLFWEAARRHFLFLRPPRETDLAQRIAARYGLDEYRRDPESLLVVNTRGADAFKHVASVGADLVLSLIKRLGKKKRPVHIGLGAGFATMIVARRLAHLLHSDLDCPDLVLHALSAGGFLVDRPEKVPVTYFGYFDGALPKVEVVPLFSETVVPSNEYERVMQNPGVRNSLDRAAEIDIVVTSLASAKDEHGLLGQYLEYLGRMESGTNALKRMVDNGWVGDVQFRPYTAEAAIIDDCPVKAVTLFEISDLVERAKTPDKYAVLLAGPCGECSRPKTDAIIPLLKQPNLRVWTHLVTDVDTGARLLSPIE